MLRDIGETFRTLRKINMKLNPKKCMFGAVEEMFLGYMVTPEGIKSCPDKTKSVLRLPSPRTIKEVQSLNGKLAKQAFKQLKQHFSELPLLVAPKPKEELIVYLSASYGAISAVLMIERGTVQTPVYFVSRALQGPELNFGKASYVTSFRSQEASEDEYKNGASCWEKPISRTSQGRR
nr:reverse transcriptase domain-containing protein [Tanacetum cinerariifolium]